MFEKGLGLLVVVSSPSGGGKTTICRSLLHRHPDYLYSVSLTTRPRRSFEVEGKDYMFTSEEEFEQRINRGELAEWANIHGHLYGTPKVPIEKAIKDHRIILLDIDVQGGMRIREEYHQSILIFISPPSLQVLEARLRGRFTEKEEIIEKRLAIAQKEIEHWPRYGYLVINEEIEETVSSVEAIIKAETCRVERLKRG